MALEVIRKTTKGKHGAQTVVSRSRPNKQSLAERISFGTGKKNKQSEGFLDMIVNTIKKAVD
jgi:hypothetical protein